MISLRVNGISRQYNGDPNMPLLWYVRDEHGLTGTKSDYGEKLPKGHDLGLACH